ncbi:MAG: c-type cytochrome [Bdellovibrionales bacterium]|nr:c-type cytochrome [Bdellovibrionales bacterium]
MKEVIKVGGAVLGVLFLMVLGLFVLSSSRLSSVLNASVAPPPLEGIVEAAQKGDVNVGERVVRVRNDCTGCHGKDLSGAWVVDNPVIGKIWGSNITPAALKDWSNEEVANAIRYGIGRDGKPLVLMPSHEYQNLSVEDIGAMVAYLRMIPPVERENEPIEIGPLAKILFNLGRMPNLVPFASGMVRTDLPKVTKPAEEPTAEFGKYLVTTACTGCHGETMAGGAIPGAPPDWPDASDLSSDALKSWSEDKFIQSIRSGISRGGQPLRPPMPVEAMKQMSDVELKAIWAYLNGGEAAGSAER